MQPQQALISGLALLAGSTLPASAVQPDGLAGKAVVDPATGKTYELLVSQPHGPMPAGGFPALFLFDGNYTAPLALAWLRRHGLADRVLVVGLGYPDTKDFNVPRRFADLTPTFASAHPGSGRSAAFLGFIERVVKPRIARRYLIDDDRMALFGHSLGGLAVLSRLLSNVDTFSAYFAASPSLWWDDNALMTNIDDFDKNCAFSTSHLITITVGRNEQPRDPASEPDPKRRARSISRRMVDHAQQAADMLARCDELDVRYRVFDDTGHLPALERGLDFALSRWLLDGPASGSKQ